MRILYLLAIALFLYASPSFAQKLEWISYNEAVALQKENPKKILMKVFVKDICLDCDRFDEETFANKKLIKYVKEHYYTVALDGEGNDVVDYDGFTYTNPTYVEGAKRNNTHLFVDALRIPTYPALVFFETDGSIIQAIPGFKDAKELEIYLKMVASGDYKKILTPEAWENYQRKFKGTF